MKIDGELSKMRNFGFIRIEWKVKNYFAATCMQNWVIGSPSFTVNGKYSTKWRLFLQPKNTGEKPTVCASLVKVESDSLQEPIWVTWRLFFPCDIGRSEDEVESDFQKKNSLEIEICDADELEKLLEYSAEDTFIIRSVIFVSCIHSQVYQRSNDLGLKSLSQDLTVLYRVDKKCDLELRIGGFPAKAHKAILYCRNKVLKRAIERDDSETKLPEFDMNAVKHVFGYLYTGNLDHVLRKPSLSILQCINYFGIKEIEEYYKYDEFELCSEFKMKEYKFEYVIPVELIADSNLIISSPSIEKDFNTSERVSVKEFSATSISGMYGYISVFIDDVIEKFPKISYVEIAVMNSNGSSEHLQRRRCLHEGISFENFLPRNILNNFTYTCDGNLHLLCNFYIPMMGSRMLSIDRKKVHSDICIDSEKHYKMLSDQIGTLFETGIYSDITIICDDEKFPVHTNILCARSHVFRKLIERITVVGNVKYLDLSWLKMKSNVLRTVLYYIYSGKLLTSETDEILDIYVAAETFYVLPLKYICSKMLQENMESLDIKSVLCVAEKLKDYKLIASIQKFINRKLSDCIEGIAGMHIK